VTTRKEQVLDRLRLTPNQWVDGPDLASEWVGGSEGLKRLRELRGEGYPIEKRWHPESKRKIFQYRIFDEASNGTLAAQESEPAWRREWRCETCGSAPVDRPQRLPGDLGNARCATCRARRLFRSIAA
jgi:DNA-directed RNA polymerase subunit RPC12/RpoP